MVFALKTKHHRHVDMSIEGKLLKKQSEHGTRFDTRTEYRRLRHHVKRLALSATLHAMRIRDKD